MCGNPEMKAASSLFSELLGAWLARPGPLCPEKAAHAFHLISCFEETLLKPPGEERAALSLLLLLSWAAYLHCFQSPFGTRVWCHRDPVSVEEAESPLCQPG